jgi:co-chaperonin GroES (HSP10)
MISKLLPKRVAVIPIRDPDTIDAKARFTPAEVEWMKKEGITNLQMNASIVVPENAKRRTDQGIVKYIGDDVRDIRVGDYVIFSGFSGQLMHFKGEGPNGEPQSEDLIIIHSDFVFAVLDEIPFTPVPGLYFKTRDADNKVIYEPANYEVAATLIRDAFAFYNRLPIDVKTRQLTNEEYDVTRGG